MAEDQKENLDELVDKELAAMQICYDAIFSLPECSKRRIQDWLCSIFPRVPYEPIIKAKKP